MPDGGARRTFLDWGRPLLPQAVAHLAQDWTGAGPLDLGNRLVVVPTRQAGRRLREALALHAAERGQAVFPPRVTTPDGLLNDPGGEEASRLQTALGWVRVLREIDLDHFRAVFPVDPPARSFEWAFRLGRQFARLQGTLAESGLRLSDVRARAGEGFQEAERWERLAALEQLHARALADGGLREPQASKIRRSQAPAVPECTAITMIGTPDPLPLALTALEILSRAIPTEVLVLAPPDTAVAFDRWGRPIPEPWAARPFDLRGFEQRVHLCTGPDEQAEGIAALAAGYGAAADGALGIAAGDSALLPQLERSLRRAGKVAFNPEGRSRKSDRLFALLSALAALSRDASYETVAALCRCPDFLDCVESRGGAGFSAAGFLARLDEIRAEYLAPDLAELERHSPAERALALVSELRAILRRGAFPDNAAAALDLLFAARRFDLGRDEDATAAEAAQAWADAMRETAGAAEALGRLPTGDAWEAALWLYSSGRHYDERPEGALELQGWLEVLWEDAPHLAVAGMNDGAVPEAVVGDAFLPESLREKLGLKTNAARFARDAYILQAVAASRRDSGQLDLFLGKVSGAGEPLRPSRLFLACADEALPGRVAFLFGAAGPSQPTPPWRRAWKLRPRRAPAVSRAAVTGFKAWLACPFRFYLQRVLRLEEVDPAKCELDAFDFGRLCHGALEAMGTEPALRDCTDEAALREFLLGRLEIDARERLGRELTLPLVIQLESARQRLRRAAATQARVRAEGWIISEVERPFSLRVGTLTVEGRIDRIDRHEATGAVRLIDYKTTDKPERPVEAHLRAARRAEDAPAFARFGAGRDERVWKDLQLPLYRHAVASSFPGIIECGYFNLPKAAGAGGISLWDDYSRELQEAAWRCAGGIADAISRDVFWPPAEGVRPESDPFATLFHQGAADSIEWEGRG